MHHNHDAVIDRTDLAAPVSRDIDSPSRVAEEILLGLFMGGTHEDATVADPMPLASLGGWRECDPSSRSTASSDHGAGQPG